MDAIRIVLACIKNADYDFNLINNGDRIAIGVSGGKDSMALLYALNLYKKFTNMNFDIVPIIIDLGFDGFDPEPISKYVESLGLQLNVADGKIVYPILKKQQELQKYDKLPCSICSRMKKAIINKEAHRLKCNKVSFAHHKTDAIETLFLNEIYGGRIGTFSPKMFLTNEKITFIRPLIYCDESDIKRLVKEVSIPVFSSHCPNDGKTKRADIKSLLLDINSAYPSSKDNFLTMLNNEEKLDIFFQHFEYKIDGTPLYYKEIKSLIDFLDEQKYIKASNKINSISHHIHIYEGDKKVGFILYHNEGKNYFLTNIYIKNSAYLWLVILAIYKKIYAKVNPINFYVSIKKYKYVLEKLHFKEDHQYILIDDNPIKLEKKIKGED